MDGLYFRQFDFPVLYMLIVRYLSVNEVQNALGVRRNYFHGRSVRSDIDNLRSCQVTYCKIQFVQDE